MQRCFRFMLVFVLLACTFPSNGQILKSWHGEWKGVMHMYKQGMQTDSVPIVLEVRPISDSVLVWKTSYLSVKMPMVKDYTMKVIDPAKGHYATDEGEGLLLDTYLFDNSLYSVFEVQDILLTATYRLKGNEIIFEVTSGRKAGKVPGDVNNYSVNFLQKAILKK